MSFIDNPKNTISCYVDALMVEEDCCDKWYIDGGYENHLITFLITGYRNNTAKFNIYFWGERVKDMCKLEKADTREELILKARNWLKDTISELIKLIAQRME